MRLGIIGLPQSGKKTIFKTIIRLRSDKEIEISSPPDPTIATITIFDDRLKFLSKLFNPKKTVFLKMEYFLPAEISTSIKSEKSIWNQVRTCDGLIHIIRNFELLEGSPPDPERDFWSLEEEMILSDLMVVEKRIEKIKSDISRGKKSKELEKELQLLSMCRDILEKGESLRQHADMINNSMLKGFTFLSVKPMLLVINNEEDINSIPIWKKAPSFLRIVSVRGRLEFELSQMNEEESKEFKELYDLKSFSIDKIVKESFTILNKITFFTAGDKEVRAWTIDNGATALDAAGEIHSDMKKGFISAEVISFEDLKRCGSILEAKKLGILRLEGKDYIVKDGDIITFRFNV